MAVGRPPDENRGRPPDTKGNGLDGTTAVSPARLDDTTLARDLDAEATIPPLPGEPGYMAWLAVTGVDPYPWWPLP
jgi:hypothetical protein